MGDAWIYTPDADGGDPLAGMLAELGFSPRRVASDAPELRPSDTGSGIPEVALVLGDTSVCTRLRDDEDLAGVPVVVSVDSDALALGNGVLDATELLVTPFSANELEARIVRARRTVHGVEHGDVVRVGGLELNVATYQVTVDGRPVDFTYMEYELLKFLVTHPRRAFSREALLSRVWGYDFYGGARTVDVHVRRVRAKLGSEYADKLHTVRRVGYRFDP
ncbi:MAG: response regulator transcription factor [Solirubrobacterales bacterium]|nr:response regulator transcription factor [Solirubrobacterales bacterium]